MGRPARLINMAVPINEAIPYSKKNSSIKPYGLIPDDLFGHYPQLATWLKCKRTNHGNNLLRAYQTCLEILSVRQQLTNVDCSMLSRRHYRPVSGNKHAFYPGRIQKSLKNFLTFHWATLEEREVILSEVEKQDWQNELLWMLKYRFEKDRGMAMNPERVACIQKELQLLEEKRRHDISEEDERLRATIELLDTERESLIKNNPDIEQYEGEDTMPRLEINKDLMIAFSVVYTNFYVWLKERNLHTFYDLIAKQSSKVGTNEQIRKRCIQEIKEKTGVELLDSYVGYAMGNVRLIQRLMDLPQAQRPDFIKNISQHSDYVLLDLLRQFEKTGKVYEPNGDFWSRVKKAAKALAQPEPPADEDESPSPAGPTPEGAGNSDDELEGDETEEDESEGDAAEEDENEDEDEEEVESTSTSGNLPSLGEPSALAPLNSDSTVPAMPPIKDVRSQASTLKKDAMIAAAEMIRKLKEEKEYWRQTSQVWEDRVKELEKVIDDLQAQLQTNQDEDEAFDMLTQALEAAQDET